METWKQLVPNPHVVGGAKQRVYLTVSGARDPSPTLDDPAQGSVPGREVPVTNGWKDQWGLC